MTALSVKNICCKYDKTDIIKNACFEIEEGRLCALLGLNGCGKTTLIKAICNLIPSTGNVYVKGRSLLNMSSKELSHNISYIPQRGSLILGKTALDVVEMGFNPELGIFENPGEKEKNKALEVLDSLGIISVSDVLYDQLSEGLKQLTILARALAQDTPVLMLDEPDSAMDFINRNMIFEKLLNTVRKNNKACLISLHDPNLAFSWCDSIFIMKDGTIINRIDKKDFGSFQRLKTILSEIYGEIEILSNNGIPVMVKSFSG